MDLEEYLLQYRPNVGIVLFNQFGQVWLGHRTMDALEPGQQKDDHHRWQMGLRVGSTRVSQFVTLLFVSYGKRRASCLPKVICVSPGWLPYDFPPEHKAKKWRGQRQKWVAMLFHGQDEEIDLQADDHQEFDEWRWAELEEAPKLIVPFKTPRLSGGCTGVSSLA